VSTEHHEEPAVLHALEEVRDALRTEEGAQEPLSRENARLRARVEQLQSERDQLLRAAEGPGEEPSSRAPRLPEALVPPFDLHAQDFPRRKLLRWFLPAPVVVVIMLAVTWDQGHVARVFNLALFLMVLGVQGGLLWWSKRRPQWHFDVFAFEGKVERLSHTVGYANVRSVEVYSSPSQRRRGLGTLVVTYYTAVSGTLGEQCMQMKDVPEPERLAAWLRAKGSDTP
jgi:membrane protein YdbS with pleckstrin-like domain